MKNIKLKLIEEIGNIHLSPREHNNKYYGLVEGEVGLMLCNAHYYKLFHDEKYYTNCSDLLEKLLSKYNNNYTLGYGLTGIAWGVNELKSNGILENDCDIWLKNADSILIEKYYTMIEKSNFDYFSGATGILNYFIQNNTINSSLTNMTETFLKKISNLPANYFFSPQKEQDSKGSFCKILNLGVPHGLTGIILLLLKLERKMNLGLEPLIYHFIDNFWELRNTEGKQFIFPSLMGDVKRDSTLAWCYGDLPILFLLTQIVRMSNGTKYEEHLKLVYDNTIKRDDYFLNNFTLCHGLPSIMYLYYKLWKTTSQKTYYTLYKRWESRMETEWTKNISLNENQMSSFLNDPTLFNGIPGYLIIILTVNGYIPDTWDNILLI